MTVDTSTRDKIQYGIQLLRTKGYDWNGTCGLPIRSDVLQTSSAIFSDRTLQSQMRLEDCDEPVMSLNPDGSVEMSFDTPYGDGGKQLLLTFQCGGVITYIKILEDSETSIEGTIRASFPAKSASEFAELVDLINWIAEE
jgi:hypothetical protein